MMNLPDFAGILTAVLALVYNTSKLLFLQEQKSISAIVPHAHRTTQNRLYQPE
jgi:hypothetical protein